MALNANTVVIVFGIRRSGNHLISDWIVNQYITPGFQAKNVQIDFFSFLDNYSTDFDFYNCALFGIEEHPIHAVDIAYTKNAFNIIKVVILRDPYNLFASRIKSYRLLEAPYFNGGFATYNWTDYANFFLNPSEGVICIPYHVFLMDGDYRKQLAKKLGVGFKKDMDSKYINKVDSTTSRGSSFDGDQYDGQAQQMKVMNRWEYYRDNPLFRSLFTDEIKQLSKEIFDFNPF